MSERLESNGKDTIWYPNIINKEQKGLNDFSKEEIILMRVLVAYMSQTGCTEKVAKAIFDEIQFEKDLKQIKELDGLEGYDLYFVGCPIHGFAPAPPAKELLEKHTAGKDVVIFVTHAAPEIPEFDSMWSDICRAAAIGANIVGFFNCRGELSQKVADAVRNSDNPELAAFASMRDETLGLPDAERLERACLFTREIMCKYSSQPG